MPLLRRRWPGTVASRRSPSTAQHRYLLHRLQSPLPNLHARAPPKFNYLGINPIDALFWTAVLNGVLAPPLMVLIMLVANHRDVMGDRVNGRWTNLMGWLATVAMFAAAIALFLTWGQ